MNSKAKGLIVGLVLGVGLMVIPLAGLALAQGPEEVRQALARRVEAKACWLILDPAKPVDEILPPLLKLLAGLKARAEIVDFAQTPQSSAPTAVSGLRVMARPGALNVLRGLPGVLDVSDRLPPPPPAPGDIGAMSATATITGRVTEAETGTPQSFTQVSIYDAVSYTWLTWAIPDVDGYYTATVTAPFSRVKVGFEDGSWPLLYAPEWYNDKTYFSSADAIDLSAGGTVSNINAALEKLGTISGTVTFDGSSLPAAPVSVRAYTSDGAWLRSWSWSSSWSWEDETDWAGHYDLSLPPGAYRLRFSGDPIVEEWYQDKMSQPGADTITVTGGMTTAVNASVGAAGRITGLVTDEVSGLPIIDVWVSVYDLRGNSMGSDFTDFDGRYEIGGLGTGSYKIGFIMEGYNTEYYNNKPTLAQATLVGITAGQTTSNINAALSLLPSTISGMITKDGGTPLHFGEDVYVDLYDVASGDWIEDYYFEGDDDTTDFSFRVLPGTYKVLFDGVDPGFRVEWYHNRTSLATADLVTVAAGQVATGVSADLTTATGCMAGTVTTADDGSGIQYVDVDVFYTGEWSWYTQTDSNGEYQLCGLAGDFLVRFSHDPYQVEWYNNRSSQMTADTVTIVNWATTPNINAVLDLGGCISGRVVDASGLFRPEALVILFDSTGHWLNWYDWLDVDAGYVFCGLPTGNYVVECYDWELNGSTMVSVTAAQGTTDVICQLIPPTYTYTYLPLILKNSR
jgi:5-hydroxyisourate hydrolase-like protein (transthyretin family)